MLLLGLILFVGLLTLWAVSGVAYSDEGVTPLGSGLSISLYVNGTLNQTVTTGSGGTFSFAATPTNGTSCAVVLNGAGGQRGVCYVLGTGLSISGKSLYQNELLLQSVVGGSSQLTTIYASGGIAALNAIFSMSGNSVIMASGKTFNAGAVNCGLTSGGTITIQGGNLANTGGGLSLPAIVWSGTGSIDLSATASVVLTGLTLSSGTCTVTTGAKILTANSLTFSGGTLALGSSNMAVTTVTYTSGTLNAGTSTVSFGTGNVDSSAVSWNNVQIRANTTPQLTSAMTVGGTLTFLASTSTLNANGQALSVAGNWDNSAGGTFTANSNTVTLNGTSQTIKGSTTFYNLVKTVAAADTLTFTDGTTQTVTNALTLQGASGQLLTLAGTSTGGWTISVPATQTLDHLSVSYSTATTTTAAAGSTSTDGGHNTNWTFGVSAPVANFTATPVSGPAPLTVPYTDTSTNTPTSWAWDFGDGSTSTAQNPSHTYATAGIFTVSLTATNAGGSNTKTATAFVTVTPADDPGTEGSPTMLCILRNKLGRI